VFSCNLKIQHCTRYSHTIVRSEFFESSLSLKYSNALIDIVLMITTIVRRRLRWEDNIKMDLQEVRCGGVDWISWLRIGTGGGHL